MGPDNADTKSVSENVLRTFQQHDDGARVVSVLRDACGRSVVRLRSSRSHAADSLLSVMQRAMPLAKASVIENVLDGTVETEVVVPTRADERAVALSKASATLTATALSYAAYILFLAGGVVWVASACNYSIFRN